MARTGFKTRKRYRLTFVSENTLNTLWTLRLSRTRAWLLAALCMAAVGALVALLLGATPLGSILPGYMRPEQRRTSVENALRVDSLLERQSEQAAWLANVTAILAGREDSVSASGSETPVPESADTLLAASEAERRFVDAWTERERYNLSVVTPVVAQSMSFSAPVLSAMAVDSIGAGSVRISGPRRATVMSIHDATVLDAHLDVPSGQWVIILQHPNEFVSRYEGLASSFVAAGQRIKAGAALGLSADEGQISLRIWRNGSAVDPRTLLPL